MCYNGKAKDSYQLALAFVVVSLIFKLINLLISSALSTIMRCWPPLIKISSEFSEGGRSLSLVPDIFNYLLSTFISSHLLPCSWIDAFLFSYFKHCCTSEEKITTVSSNFYVGVLDSGSLGVYGAHCYIL